MRPEKKAIVDEIRRKADGVSCAFLADYCGMTVAQTGELRKRLAKQNAEFHVVKNDYFKVVAVERKWMVPETKLTGRTAVVFGRGDAVDTAKTLAVFKQEHKLLVVRQGFMDGRPLDARQFEELTKLPPKLVLQAMLVGTLAAPMTRLAGVMRQKVASIVYVLKAGQDKKEKAQ